MTKSGMFKTYHAVFRGTWSNVNNLILLTTYQVFDSLIIDTNHTIDGKINFIHNGHFANITPTSQGSKCWSIIIPFTGVLDTNTNC